MTHPFPTPPNDPFERLQPTDGMFITAMHWKNQANYHRRYQNLHYQSVNQPGVVSGLGVCAIAAPNGVADQRWVQIQPGIAIDLAGNSIIVPKPVPFRITTQLRDSQSVMVYLVAKYRDPDELEAQTSQIVQETFRINEKSTLPDSGMGEVELCRICLQIDKNAITKPADVLFPGYGNIDLRYRSPAKARPQALVRAAQINRSDDPESSRNFSNLLCLLQAVERYCPSIRGVEVIEQVDWSDLQGCDLLYLTGQQKLSLNALEVAALKSYLHSGGTLLVDVPAEATELIESVQSLADRQLKTPLKPLEQLRGDHPLRNQPFLFDALPLINQQPLQLLSGTGLILVIGDLGSAWGLERRLNLPRSTIRDAQELGVNILHYAWQRRQFTNLQKEE